MQYITETKAEELFNDYIDQTHETIIILGMKYCPSTVLMEVDPVAYNCELANFLDSEGLTTEEEEAD